MTYVFNEDAVIVVKNSKEASPQKIGESLEKICADNGGELTASAVLEIARDPKHLLHGFFEWDDKIAAEAYRLDQARAVIRLVRIEDGETGETPRAFMSVVTDKGRSYRRFNDIKNSDDLREAVLAQAQRDLEAFEMRYRTLKEVLEHVSKAKAAVVRRRRPAKVENHPSP